MSEPKAGACDASLQRNAARATNTDAVPCLVTTVPASFCQSIGMRGRRDHDNDRDES